MLTSPRTVFDLVHAPGFTLAKLKGLLVSQHFGWTEVFTNRTAAQIKSAPFRIFENAVRQAAILEKIRAYLKAKLGIEPIMTVSSWWRPAAVNANIKGAAKKSSHLEALATDWTVRGYVDPAGNKKIQALLISQVEKFGFCLEITNGGWTHTDARPDRIVFENKGNGDYPVWGVTTRAAFVKKYGSKQ